MADKKRIYPWLKSIFGKKDDASIRCVYDGPEMRPDDADRDDPIMEEVYAGPEFYEGKSAPDAAEEDAPIPEEPDGAGEPEKPLPRPEPPIFMCVYAGPAYFADQAADDEPQAPTRICPACGALLDPDSTFCFKCGAEQT